VIRDTFGPFNTLESPTVCSSFYSEIPVQYYSGQGPESTDKRNYLYSGRIL